MTSGFPSLPPCTIIKNWTWNNEFPTEAMVPCINSKCVMVEDDDNPILFRTLELKQKKDESARNQEAASRLKAKQAASNQSQSEVAILQAPVHKMSVPQLKDTLKSLGLKSTGTREELRQRLEKFISK